MTQILPIPKIILGVSRTLNRIHVSVSFNLNKIHDSVGKALRTADQGREIANSHALSFSFHPGFTDLKDKGKVNTRRTKDGWEKRKLYEVMLLEEIPGTL
jgi:hypothetical protein